MLGVLRIDADKILSWQPSVCMDVLQARARLLAGIRKFFEQRQVLEVETPLLSRSTIPDPQLESFQTTYSGPGSNGGELFYLQTSPEFFMKRLLAISAVSIYQLSRVFRNEEYGNKHNPEFTLLEWYRPGFNHHQLMDEVEILLNRVVSGINAGEPFERLSYQQLFEKYASIDPLAVDIADMMVCLQDHAIVVPENMPQSVTPWLDLVLTHVIEPQMPKACFVYDYPVDQAALARLSKSDPVVAERFELYINGIELANGFHELTDSAEQRRRFENENQQRKKNGQPQVKLDEFFLQALESGLPSCAGVALGVDRLMMVALGVDRIDQVMAFPFSRV